MFEKVNPSHPDKVADRIAGAIVDLAYKTEAKPKVAVEVLIGHGVCHIITEASCAFDNLEIIKIVKRITQDDSIVVDFQSVKQDPILAGNQKEEARCGDNGIFKGMPLTEEEKTLAKIARKIYLTYNTDGKYILDEENKRLIICQSHAISQDLKAIYKEADINPLGDWTGGTNVDAGATNRKLGSDMGRSVTGGGLHGKDLTKADVSVNIYAFLKAQKTGQPVELCCAIGDKTIDGRPYSEIIATAQKYIYEIGGFEKFAEWGLI